MTTKIKTVEDCASGMDYLELAQREGWPVRKNGSYYEIHQGEYIIRVPNKATAMPKETRSMINGALIKAGLLVAAVVAVLWWWVL